MTKMVIQRMSIFIVQKAAFCCGLLSLRLLWELLCDKICDNFLDMDMLVLVCCKSWRLIWNHSVQPARQDRQFDVAFSFQWQGVAVIVCICNAEILTGL